VGSGVAIAEVGHLAGLSIATGSQTLNITLIFPDIATACDAEIAQDSAAVAPESGSAPYAERVCPLACWEH
jgi:hypothetical protein